VNRFVSVHGVCGADEGVDLPLVRRTASGPACGHLASQLRRPAGNLNALHDGREVADHGP
jgi:hypothetical protein